MEAGYDYLLLRGGLQRNLFKYVGIFFLVFGAALLATGGAYYGYAAKARADLHQLNASIPGALGENDGTLSSLIPDEAPAKAARVLPNFSGAEIRGLQLYPGEQLTAGAWGNPWSYEPPEYRQLLLLQGFTPVDASYAVPVGELDAATRLILPTVDIDSTVKELAVLDLGASRAYETPDQVVGHIPETAQAGEAGGAWFFGHTESPILGEGSVFFNLRKVPDQLRNGEEVFIIAETGNRQFLYRVTSTKVVYQDDMKLFDSGRATIHLVSCVPRLVYDHRLIVTGELVADKSTS